MKPKNIIYIIIIYFTLLCSCSGKNNKPKIEKGILDLTSWDFEKDGKVKLDGEWEFYWKQLIEPKQFDKFQENREYITVKGFGTWSKYSKFGYATYRLRIILPKTNENPKIDFKKYNLFSSSRVWFNGKEVLKVGRVDSLKDKYVPEFVMYRHFLDQQKYKMLSDTLEVVIQSADYHWGKGGVRECTISTPNQIHKSTDTRIIYDSIIISILFTMGVYHILLFFFRRNEKSTLFFSLLSLDVLLRALSTTGFTFYLFPHSLSLRLIYLWIPLYPMLLSNFVYHLYSSIFNYKILKIINIVGILFTIFCMFTPINYLILGEKIIGAYIFIVLFYLFFNVNLKAVRYKKQGALFSFFGVFILIIGTINDFVFVMGKTFIVSFPLAQMSLAIYVIIQSVNIAERFSISFKKNNELNKTLDYQNKNLEKIVKKRTERITYQKEDILEKNEELNQQNEEMQAQSDNLLELNDEMNLKNNKLLEQKEKIQVQAKKLLSSTQVLEKQNSKLKVQHQQITDSVKYAKNIQTAILPFISRIEQYIELFILYKPKDIVSGDFYWFTHLKKIDGHSAKTFIAAIDCTGHGVPGAFMSMIGNQLLNKIVNEQKITKPHKILLQLHNDVIATLKQTINENDDGMDVCLICIENLFNNTHRVQFSGAKRPLFYTDTETNKIININGTRKSIGGKEYQSEMDEFEQHELYLKKGTVLYLTSDGYIDQNGANKKRIGSPLLIKMLNKINHKPLKEQKIYLENELDSIQGGYKQRDDITIIGLKI